MVEPGLFSRTEGLSESWGPSPIFARPRLEAMRMTLAGRSGALTSAPPSRPARPPGSFAAGDRIFHQKFGYGTVRSAEGSKLAIAFDKAGDKMVIDSFVEKA